MDDFKIDSHKLIYHVERLNSWQKGEIIAPIYLEISPSGSCNHRCIFCALDYRGYKPQFLDTKTLKNSLKIAAECGVKSVMYAGEGEPFLHKDIIEIINFTKKSGLDAAVTTNGTLLSDEIIKNCLESLSWIRISFNAAAAKTYKKIHRGCEGDFEKALSNLEKAVEFKRKKKLNCAIGVQLLLIPENKKEVIKLAKILKAVKVDYFTIKPFSKHPMSRTCIDKNFDYRQFFYLKNKLKKIAANDFKVVFRSNAMKKLKEGRQYKHCLGLPFWAYIDSAGNVWACSAYLGKKAFVYGNIYKDNFDTVLYSKKRRRIIEMAAVSLDTKRCREICRLDEINKYLDELKNPLPHVNFI